MFGALAQFILRDWRSHRLRLVLTMLGIGLGTAIFFAIQTTNAGLVASLDRTIEKLGGRATLQITGGESGFARETIKTVRATPGVQLAEPVLESVTTAELGGASQKLLVLGLDTESDLALYKDTIDQNAVMIRDPVEFANSTDSAAVSERLAATRGLKNGDKLRLDSPTGPVDVTVRGTYRAVGIGDVYDGNVIVMDLYAAEKLFGRGDKIDRIDVLNKGGVTPDELTSTLAAKLGPGIEVTRPELRGREIENTVTTLHAALQLVSLFALTIAVFLIFNSFSISVSQRWREIAILRSIGVERHGIRLMFLSEALILGLVGSAVGVGIGLVISFAAVASVAQMTAVIYGVVESSASVSFDVTYAAEAFLLGLAASLVGAWFPARRAAYLEPVQALRNVEVRTSETAPGWWAPLVGICLLAVGIASTRLVSATVGSYSETAFAVAMLAGVILLLPTFLRVGARILKPVMSRVFGVEGAIAVETMASSPRRSVATIAAIAVGLSFVFSNAALIGSLKDALNRSVDKALAADILISSSDQLHSRTQHFGASTAAVVAALPEVADADLMRISSFKYQGAEVTILAHDMDEYFKMSPDLLDDGDAASARRATAAGNAVLISSNMALRWGLKIGDLIAIETPKGELSLPIAGTLDYYRSEIGTVFLDRALYKKYWDDDTVDYIALDLSPGADPEQFKRSAQAAIAGSQRAFIYTHDEYKAWVTQLIDQFFMLMYVQMLVAIVVAAVGLVNTMLISIIERRREIGIFRAVGGCRSQVVRLVLVEAVAISLIGFAGALLGGTANGYFMIKTAAKVIAGFDLPLRFPLEQVVVAIPIIIAIALLAAWLPARRGARTPVIEAIGYE